jgi:transposase InsO family protein
MWGHRKIWKLTCNDGVEVSASTVLRLMRKHGLALPVKYQAECRQLAQKRKETFLDPPDRRNRVWQTDFTEIETAAGGTWCLSGVVDYWGKICFCCTVTATQRTVDAIAAITAAIAQAEQIMGKPLADDITDPETGQIKPVTIVTDNGSCYKSVPFARFIDNHPLLAHVRTRVRSPQTNGVIERFFGTIKYEHLYRHHLPDGTAVTDQTQKFRQIYNTIRPHETIGFQTPHNHYTNYAPSGLTNSLDRLGTCSDGPREPDRAQLAHLNR